MNEKEEFFNIGPSKEEYMDFFEKLKSDISFHPEEWFSFVRKTGILIKNYEYGVFSLKEVEDFMEEFIPYREYLVNNFFASDGRDYNEGLYIFRIEEKKLDEKIVYQFKDEEKKVRRSDVHLNFLFPKTVEIEDLLIEIVKSRDDFENNRKIGNLNDEPQKKTKAGPRFPYKIPAGTEWKNITLVFTNKEAVRILVAGKTHGTDFAGMGFADGRSGERNLQWALLRLLAERGGMILASDTDANNNFKKQKQTLSEKLKEYFSLETDPFVRYKKEDGYKLKMTIFFETERK